MKSLDNSIANALGITIPEPSTSKAPVENVSLKRPFNTEIIESATQSKQNKGTSAEEPDNRKSIKTGSKKEPTSDNNQRGNYDDLD